MNSDHFSLLITLPEISRIPLSPRLRFSTVDKKTFLALLSTNLKELGPLVKTIAGLDHSASELIRILYSAFTGSAKKSLSTNKGQPWWNQNCREAKRRYRELSRHLSPSSDAKKDYRRVVRKAKTSFFQKRPEDASIAKDVFEITKWHKSKGICRTPPLLNLLLPNSEPAYNLEDKIEVLQNLLQNQSDVEDIPLSTPTVFSTSLPFPVLTPEEISGAILGAGNTTSGKDQILMAVLRLAWPHISDTVLSLFQACINIGHHPRFFRTAILAIIGKLNKADMSSPRSYRPIALLSVLGK